MDTEKLTDLEEEKQQNDSSETSAEKEQKKKTKKLSRTEELESELEEARIQLQEQKDKFLRLYAEFDNYKKRTAKERLDLIKTAGQDVVIEMVSVIDDFERAEKAMAESDDIQAAKDGFKLIQEKLFSKLKHKGLEPMDSLYKDFDADLHEAITEIPAPNEELKGKVVDVIEKGYKLHDKIIRYAKVVVGK